VSIDKKGVGYTLRAVSGGLTPGTSTAFTITHAPPTHLVYAVQPTTTAAASPITPTIMVEARDQFENLATSYTGNVQLAITSGTGPPLANLAGGGPFAAVGGVASFPQASLDKVSPPNYQLTASATSLSSAVSNSFAIINSPVNKDSSTVVANPASITASSGSSTATITVTANDGSGNPVPGATVTLAITGSNNSPTPVSLTQTANGSGQASWTLSSTKAEVKIISAIIDAFNITQTDTVTVNHATMSQLVFTTGPNTTTAGVAINSGTGVVVTGRDQFGNTATSFTGNMTMTIATGPVGGVFTATSTTTVPASAGVGTFSNLHIRKVGSYTIQASTALPALNVTSAAFSITTAPPSQLTWTTQPTNTAVVAIIDSTVGGVVVSVQDSVGNTVLTASNSITVALFDNTTGGILSGTKTRNASSGVAIFNDLRVDKLGNYTLIANASLLSNEVSQFFSIVPGPASALFFTVQPPAQTVGGQVFSTAPQVTARDNQGNVATGFTGNITVAIGTNPGSPPGTLGGTKTRAAVAGIVSFPGLSIDNAGVGYTLTASAAPPVTGASSNPFNIIAGGASASHSTVLATTPITACNTGCTPGGGTQSVITVTARDSLNNPIAGATVTLSATGSMNNLTQPATTTNASGVATGTLSSTVNETKVVSATITVGGNPPVTVIQTQNVLVNPAAPAVLAFIRNPNLNTVAGTVINPVNGVQVSVNDAFGNRVTSAGTTVTVQLNNPPPAGTLLGTLSRTPVAGVVTFNDLRIKEAGTGYTLIATGLPTPDASTSFNITVAPPAKLAFFQQPSTTSGGATITPAVVVEVQDSVGNRVGTATNSITMVIGTNPNNGTLSGTLTVSASAGIASFNNLSIDSAGNGYRLSASATGLTGATSNLFNIIVGAAAKLGFHTQPTGSTGGVPISPFQVEVQDLGGNRVATATNSITLAILNNVGPNATLGGPNPVAASTGIATFSNITIDSAGNGYTLQATATGLSADTSAAFNINVGPAAKLGFFQQPSNTVAGVAINPPVIVEVRDAGGNRVTSASNSIAIAIGTNPSSGTLSGTTPVTAISGRATFSDLSIDKIGNGYTLLASSTGLTFATSSTFNITAGGATKLAFFVQPPSSTAGGATMTPAVQVEVQDAGGNRVGTATNSITVAIGTNPNSGNLGGTKTVAASSGVAQFSTLSIDSAGNGYTLTASASGLAGATSNTFNITVGSASKLGFLVQPSNGSGGSTLPSVQVEVRDLGGNRVPSASNSITLSIGTNPGPNAALTGGGATPASGGVAAFSSLSIDSAGTGYTLVATATGLTMATSNAFNIAVGPASKLGFLQQPPSNTNGGAVMSPAMTVEVRDAGGNRVTTANNSITLAIGNNVGPSATLSGTNPVSATNGLASFSGMSIDSAGSGYTLTANASGVNGATSSSFNINVGPQTKVGFRVQPASAVAGVGIATFQVEIQDAGGNRVTTGPNRNVTITIQNNAGSPPGTLAGDPANPTAAGLVSFPGLSIDKAGVGYTLLATPGGGLATATSTGFDITHAGADHLVYTVQPSNTQHDQPITPAVVVEIRDAFDNLVTDATDDVTLVIGTDPSGGLGTLSNGGPLAAVGGVATFAALSIDLLGIGNGYTLVAGASGMTGATSVTFDITP